MTELIPTIATAVFWAITIVMIIWVLLFFGAIFTLKENKPIKITINYWKLTLFLTIYILSILLK